MPETTDVGCHCSASDCTLHPQSEDFHDESLNAARFSGLPLWIGRNGGGRGEPSRGQKTLADANCQTVFMQNPHVVALAAAKINRSAVRPRAAHHVHIGRSVSRAGYVLQPSLGEARMGASCVYAESRRSTLWNVHRSGETQPSERVARREQAAGWTSAR